MNEIIWEQFRKKPVIVTAFRWDGQPLPEPGIQGFKLEIEDNVNVLRVPTLNGMATAVPGDWIVCGLQNEFYPCKPEIFEATYEKPAA